MVSEELVWLSGWGWEGQAVKEDRVLGRTPSTTGVGGQGELGRCQDGGLFWCVKSEPLVWSLMEQDRLGG